MSVESAVSFAASMIRKGEYVGKAICIAAHYYKVEPDEVQRGLASRSGRSRRGKKVVKPVRQCFRCGEKEATWRLTYTHTGYIKGSTYYMCEDCRNTPDMAFTIAYEYEEYRSYGNDFGEGVWTKYKPTEQEKS